jgi:ubiquinone/menaquinone biosynthesis C-methylase UbiE
MDHREVGRYWDGNADVWTRLARAGYDVFRDLVNTPAFFSMLGDVRGLHVLDIGCGEGYNTRLLAEHGARVVAIDIAQRFIGYAVDLERQAPMGIEYRIASAVELPFADASFDAVTAFMSLMDIPETDRAIAEAFRVLRPGGFLQFSIGHPCFMTPHWRAVFDDQGNKVAVEVGGYFENMNGSIEEWMFSAAPPEVRDGLQPFRIPRFTRTMSQWLNLLIDTGFTIERASEPYPSDDAVRQAPRLVRARVVADFFHLRVRKPGPTSCREAGSAAMALE